ncbi:hypothetical protein, partial [Mogibacterium diversum]|uniref:hypothetical protein n=1 Tax=Mogibacterium diversum TaxID=114527 RepID=UPI0023A8C305
YSCLEWRKVRLVESYGTSVPGRACADDAPHAGQDGGIGRATEGNAPAEALRVLPEVFLLGH